MDKPDGLGRRPGSRDLDPGIACLFCQPRFQCAEGALQRAHRLANEIDSGVVCVNEWQASLPETPFGGHKDSGLGSEGGIEGLEAYTNRKFISQG